VSGPEVIAAQARWAARLAAVAAPALQGSSLGFLVSPGASRPPPAALAGVVAEWRDDAGHRRAADGWLLAHLLGVSLPAPPARVALPWATLWQEVCAATAASGPMPLAWSPGITSLLAPGAAGPLFPEVHQQAIEVWTEGELTGLHALSVLASAPLDAARAQAVRARVTSAAQWLIAELQPDNATNRPWGIHVFAGLAARGDMLADLYAQTMLHNTLAGRLSPDRFSAAILLHAARLLEG
jgi:hypothetical protein